MARGRGGAGGAGDALKALDAETRRAVRCFAGAGLVLSPLLTALCAYGFLTGRGRLSVAAAGLLLAALNAGALWLFRPARRS
ncbi:hypothetical protein [Streptomyces lavendofoliae]|uniref:hypothetical protein n=1 Tax=Streptomyces lavendofoliae TaxID=67314 RepID=UPI003D8C4C32